MGEREPLTREVIGAAIEVHRLMGPGLLESVFQDCMDQEMRLRGLEFAAQARLPLLYKGVEVGDGFVLDFHFGGRLVVELKAVERLLPIFEAQLLTYMRLSKTPVGLLLNFNVPVMKDGIKRMVL